MSAIVFIKITLEGWILAYYYSPITSGFELIHAIKKVAVDKLSGYKPGYIKELILNGVLDADKNLQLNTPDILDDEIINHFYDFAGKGDCLAMQIGLISNNKMLMWLS